MGQVQRNLAQCLIFLSWTWRARGMGITKKKKQKWGFCSVVLYEKDPSFSSLRVIPPRGRFFITFSLLGERRLSSFRFFCF
jgi:hypothetical protein